MTASRAASRVRFNAGRAQKWLVGGGLLAVVGAVIMSPLLMVRLSSGGLTWRQFADIGQAYGGASALLSAAALCGVVASLLVQRRQVRQELAEMDRQQHIDLMKLAMENPEFLEVLDVNTAGGPHARQEVFLNLMMMYWLAVWELGVVDDAELRAMAADMFGNEISRRWWARVGAVWVGPGGNRGRRRFVLIVTQELVRSRAVASRCPDVAPRALNDRGEVTGSPRHRSDLAVLAAAAAVGGVSVVVARSLRARRQVVRVCGGGLT